MSTKTEKLLYDKLTDGEIYEFSVNDYSTKMVGRYKKAKNIYDSCMVLIRGDGTITNSYLLYRINYIAKVTVNTIPFLNEMSIWKSNAINKKKEGVLQ